MLQSTQNIPKDQTCLGLPRTNMALAVWLPLRMEYTIDLQAYTELSVISISLMPNKETCVQCFAKKQK